MYTNEDIYKLKSDLEKYDGKCNIYFTLNPIKPENLEKFLKEGLSKGKSISDNEIEKYSLILIDLDPERKSKTSSSDYEYGEAKKLVIEMSEYFEKWELVNQYLQVVVMDIT